MSATPADDDVRTSAIVVTLIPDDTARVALLAALNADPRVFTAPIVRGRLPLVLEAQSRDEERVFWRRLEADPAVGMVHLTFHCDPNAHRPVPEAADATV